MGRKSSAPNILPVRKQTQSSEGGRCAGHTGLTKGIAVNRIWFTKHLISQTEEETSSVALTEVSYCVVPCSDVRVRAESMSYAVQSVNADVGLYK